MKALSTLEWGLTKKSTVSKASELEGLLRAGLPHLAKAQTVSLKPLNTLVVPLPNKELSPTRKCKALMKVIALQAGV